MDGGAHDVSWITISMVILVRVFLLFMRCYCKNEKSLFLLVLGDPHLLEGRQGGKNGTTDPDGVLTLGRGDNLDLHGGRSESGQFLGHTFTDTLEHRGTTGKDDVGVEILSDIDVALHDGLEGGIVDTWER